MKRLIYLVFFSLSILNCQDSKKDDFKPIFNGKNLEGWNGDSTYWFVKDGVLVSEVTPETILKRNSFVIYEKEQPTDFELKLNYRISTSGNSGVNYRSEKIKNKPFALRGYKSDIDGKKQIYRSKLRREKANHFSIYW